VIERLVAATEPEDVVIGGGNLVHLNELPKGCRAGNNAYAFIGGFRMWNSAYAPANSQRRNFKAAYFDSA
jgi:polyphosphate glucokinase